MDNEQYRANIESGHQLLKNKSEVPDLYNRQSVAAAQASKREEYQYKYMMKPQAASTLINTMSQSSQGSLLQDRQNSKVVEPPAHGQRAGYGLSGSGQPEASPSPSLQRDRCQKNIELLRSIFSDFTEEELSREIFTLHEVSLSSAKSGQSQGESSSQSSKQSRKLYKQKQSAQDAGDSGLHRGVQQPAGSQ